MVKGGGGHESKTTEGKTGRKNSVAKDNRDLLNSQKKVRKHVTWRGGDGKKMMRR